MVWLFLKFHVATYVCRCQLDGMLFDSYPVHTSVQFDDVYTGYHSAQQQNIFTTSMNHTPIRIFSTKRRNSAKEKKQLYNPIQITNASITAVITSIKSSVVGADRPHKYAYRLHGTLALLQHPATAADPPRCADEPRSVNNADCLRQLTIIDGQPVHTRWPRRQLCTAES